MAFAAAVIGGDMAARRILNPPTPLTEEEINILKPVFGNTLDYSRIRYSDGPFSFLQTDAFVVPGGNTIYAPEPGLRQAMAQTRTLVHEAGHIWQNQNHIGNSGIWGAFKMWLSNPFKYNHNYHYQCVSSFALTSYNMEQQGDILLDYAYTIKELKKYIEDSSYAHLHTYARDQLAKYNELRPVIAKNIPQVKNDWAAAAQAKLDTVATRHVRMERNIAASGILDKLRYIGFHQGITEETKGDYSSVILQSSRFPVNKDFYFRIEYEALQGDYTKVLSDKNCLLVYNGKTALSIQDGKAVTFNGGEWEQVIDKIYAATQALVAQKKSPMGFSSILAKNIIRTSGGPG